MPEKQRSLKDIQREYKEKKAAEAALKGGAEPAPQKPIGPLPGTKVVHPPTKARGPKKVKPPPQCRVDKVKALCGHEVDFQVFLDPKKDPFAKERLAKITGKNCKECRAKVEAERQAIIKANADARKEQGLSKKQYEHKKLEATVGRLPIGSRFDVTYIADALWRGTLTVPIPEFLRPERTEPKVFTWDSPGLFQLLKKLDIQYRGWLNRKLGKMEAATEKVAEPTEETPPQ